MRKYFEGRQLFGIYDLINKEWPLDCFDSPRVFFSAESAEDYRTKCKDYNSARYEMRVYQEKLNPNR